MRDQRPLLQELLAAHGARVRHAAVHAAVVHELELARERHAAVRAHVRGQRAVETAVHHQVLLKFIYLFYSEIKSGNSTSLLVSLLSSYLRISHLMM